MEEKRAEYSVNKDGRRLFMCESVFKNPEEKGRKDEFTRLFAILASNHGGGLKQKEEPKRRKAVQVIGG